MVNLFDILPKLSETSASTSLMKFPLYVNDEITFLPFPSKSKLEYREIKRLLISESEEDINSEDGEDAYLNIEQLTN